MNLFTMIDSFFRDRDSLYQMAAEEKNLADLCKKLLIIFLISTGFYGAAMGSFRWFHPEYYFSDFELSIAGGRSVVKEVSGVNMDTRRVYFDIGDLADVASLLQQDEKPAQSEEPRAYLSQVKGAKIRFNVTHPSDPYEVVLISTEGGYGVIELSSESVLKEADTWTMPLLVSLKAPLLFVSTLLICSMALYMLNLSFGIGLKFMPTMTLMIFSLTATGAMLGVFVPIVGFFSAVTENYHFIKVMHLLVVAVAGLFGVRVLGEGLARLAPESKDGVIKGVIKRFRTNMLLTSWLALYTIVGGQLAWTLKPWFGTPYLPSTPPFRMTSGNIYVTFFESLFQMGR